MLLTREYASCSAPLLHGMACLAIICARSEGCGLLSGLMISSAAAAVWEEACMLQSRSVLSCDADARRSFPSAWAGSNEMRILLPITILSWTALSGEVQSSYDCIEVLITIILAKAQPEPGCCKACLTETLTEWLDDHPDLIACLVYDSQCERPVGHTWYTLVCSDAHLTVML